MIQFDKNLTRKRGNRFRIDPTAPTALMPATAIRSPSFN